MNSWRRGWCGRPPWTSRNQPDQFKQCDIHSLSSWRVARLVKTQIQSTLQIPVAVFSGVLNWRVVWWLDRRLIKVFSRAYNACRLLIVLTTAPPQQGWRFRATHLHTYSHTSPKQPRPSEIQASSLHFSSSTEACFYSPLSLFTEISATTRFLSSLLTPSRACAP